MTINPHYRSGRRRQGSCAILGDVWHYPRTSQKSNEFLHFYHKTHCIVNMRSIFKGNVAIIKWRIMENILGKNVFLRKSCLLIGKISQLWFSIYRILIYVVPTKFKFPMWQWIVRWKNTFKLRTNWNRVGSNWKCGRGRRTPIKAGRSRSSLYRDDLPTIKAVRSRSSPYRDDLPTIKKIDYLDPPPSRKVEKIQ